MLVRVNNEYTLYGMVGGVSLNRDKIYEADIAYNQPGYEEEGLIFVDGILLDKECYETIED